MTTPRDDIGTPLMRCSYDCGPADSNERRVFFAYPYASFKNPNITKKMVRELLNNGEAR